MAELSIEEVDLFISGDLSSTPVCNICKKKKCYIIVKKKKKEHIQESFTKYNRIN